MDMDVSIIVGNGHRIPNSENKKQMLHIYYIIQVQNTYKLNEFIEYIRTSHSIDYYLLITIVH